MGRRVLITGGAGFIGSHTCLVLLEQGHDLVVLDNFDNSSPEALRRVQELTGSSQLTLVEGDVRDPNAVDQAFSTAGSVDGVIHFAGRKAVGESVANPLLYWDVNVHGSRVLASAMDRHGCRTLVFSSTSTAYGEPRRSLAKTLPRRRVNPCTETKVGEPMMADHAAQALGEWPACALILSVLIRASRWWDPMGFNNLPSSPRWPQADTVS